MSIVVSLKDFGGMILRFPLVVRLASDDVHGRYRRTALGPLWIVLAQAGMILGLTLVFGGLLGQDPREFVLFVACGVPIWALISSYLADMPGVFIQSRGWVEAYQLPWTIQIMRRSVGYFLTFAHQMVTFVLVMLVQQIAPTSAMLWAAPGLALVFIAGTSLGVIMAIAGARFRDLQPAMTVISGFLFIMTPVFWQRSGLAANTFVVDYNPFYYFLEIVRGPLLGQSVPVAHWIGAGVGAATLLILAIVVFAASRKRLYHWMS